MKPRFSYSHWLVLLCVSVVPGAGLLAQGGAAPDKARPPESRSEPAAPSPPKVGAAHSATVPAPEHAAAKDEFGQIDTDHDGRISAVEYGASPREALDRVADGKRAGAVGLTGGFDLARNEGRPERSRFFRRLDTDHDGYISRRELSGNP
ncbi:MAG TPA: hypothetical protein VG734_22355 [Lacunisphaera sp.]|nr:hypothetical protein [Lacunisphaera sp.]